MKRVLFQPFGLGNWFVIGLCARLTFLSESDGTHITRESLPGAIVPRR